MLGMERIGVLAAILLVLVVARVPNALSRVLMTDGTGGGKHNSEKVSPSPTPNLSPKTDVSESHQDNSQGNLCLASWEECNNNELFACLQHRENAADSKGLLLVVKNTGENNMTVKIKATPPIKIDTEITLPKGNTTKIPINATEGLEVVLNAGNENCTLHTKASYWNPFQDFPAYATHLTPIYGAYFLFVTMVIAGGTWACCKFRRGRRADTRIPYQQLEMGTQTRSSSAVDSNTADGWDEGWDEDWDEEEAAPQPSEKHTGSVSANGLTSRSTRKDGWDMDWDD